MELLSRVPKTWGAVPELSHLEEQGLGFLASAGLVERRLFLRLRVTGDKRAVETCFRFTGEVGLAQAAQPALAQAWALWETAWKAGGKAYVEASASKRQGDWRLTGRGEEAERERQSGRAGVRRLRDFLRTPSVPGADMLPPQYRFVPGVWRPVVSGGGRVEGVEVVNAGSEPLSVHVENLGEVSGSLGEFGRAIAAAFQHRAADAQAAARESPSAPVGITGATRKTEEWLGKALLLLKDHPDWKDAEIARDVGKHPSTLCRNATYQAAAKAVRGEKTDVPRGFVKKDPDSRKRSVDGIAPAESSAGEKSASGQAVAGSKYVREYCAKCGDSIRVTPDKVGKKPLCDRCES